MIVEMRGAIRMNVRKSVCFSKEVSLVFIVGSAVRSAVRGALTTIVTTAVS